MVSTRSSLDRIPRRMQSEWYDALMYSQFCYYIQQNEQKKPCYHATSRGKQASRSRLTAGDPAKIIDPDTGEITEAWIFVGVMTYSQYAFVEAFINEQQKSWITAHVHMYEFFGGVTPILVSDNVKCYTNVVTVVANKI